MFKQNIKHQLTKEDKRRILKQCFDQDSIPNINVGLKMLYDGNSTSLFVEIKHKSKMLVNTNQQNLKK